MSLAAGPLAGRHATRGLCHPVCCRRPGRSAGPAQACRGPRNRCVGCLQLKAGGDSWAVASLPHWPALGDELLLRLGVIDVAKCCIHGLGYRLRQEEVWHVAMQLGYGSSALLHAEGCVGVNSLHELIPDNSWHLLLLNLHGLW